MRLFNPRVKSRYIAMVVMALVLSQSLLGCGLFAKDSETQGQVEGATEQVTVPVRERGEQGEGTEEPLPVEGVGAVPVGDLAQDPTDEDEPLAGDENSLSVRDHVMHMVFSEPADYESVYHNVEIDASGAVLIDRYGFRSSEWYLFVACFDEYVDTSSHEAFLDDRVVGGVTFKMIQDYENLSGVASFDGMDYYFDFSWTGEKGQADYTVLDAFLSSVQFDAERTSDDNVAALAPAAFSVPEVWERASYERRYFADYVWDSSDYRYHLPENNFGGVFVCPGTVDDVRDGEFDHLLQGESIAAGVYLTFNNPNESTDVFEQQLLETFDN